MSKRTTIVLAVINAALLLFILVYERGTLSTTETAGRSNQVLRSFIRDRVARVELERGDEAPIVFVRERDEDADDGLDLGSWTLTEPLETAADADAVDGVLSALEWLGSRRVRDGVSDSDREQFGLDDPRFVVRFTVIEEQVELRIGGTAPTGEGIYAEVVGEDRVYVIEESFVESIDHDLAHFRNKQLFADFYPTGVERVELQDVTFVREDDVWRVRSPERGYANQGLVDQLTRLTRELNATRFVAEDASELAEYGLDAPWRELTVTRGEDTDDRVAHLRVGDACGEHDAERYALAGEAGPVACVLVSDIEALTLDRERLREPRLLAVAENAIERVVVERDGERLELRREEERWKLFTGPEDDVGVPTLADDGAVSAWLISLRDARAIGFEPLLEGEDLPHGIDSPTARIRVVRQGDEPDVEIVVGELDAVGVWVRRGNERALTRFPSDLQEATVVGALRFRARQVFEAEAADASRIALIHGSSEERTVRGQGGTWALEAPIEVDADRVVVREIARQLASLRAERYVAAGVEREHGLAPAPQATVSATFTPDEGEETQISLLIGAETDGGFFARRDGEDAVFLLGADRVAALTRSLASLDELTVDADGLESLRIERGELIVELSHEAGTWQTAEGATPDEARTRSLMDRLGTLRAIGVASYGDSVGTIVLRLVATRRPTVEGERVITLEIGETVGEGDEAYIPMHRDGLGIVYRLRPDTLRSLLDYAP